MAVTIANTDLSDECKAFAFHFLLMDANTPEEACELSSHAGVAERTGLPVESLDVLFGELARSGFVTMVEPGTDGLPPKFVWSLPIDEPPPEMIPQTSTVH